MRKPYPSDLTDAQWAILEPLIPAHDTGRPRINAMREVLNAIFPLNRSGCQWDMLSHDLPARSTVYNHFAILEAYYCPWPEVAPEIRGAPFAGSPEWYQPEGSPHAWS